MNISINKIVDSLMILNEIKNQHHGLKVDYWCNKNIKRLMSPYEDFLNKREDVYNRFCYEDEEGKYGIVDAERVLFNVKKCDGEAFGKELKGVISLEYDVEPYVLQKEVYDNIFFKIESGSIETIDYLMPN